MSTQGMVKEDKWKSLLRDIDEKLCDIASGDQGGSQPHKRTVDAAHRAIDFLREKYPVEEQWADMGLGPTTAHNMAG